jgi:hypothetical protein
VIKTEASGSWHVGNPAHGVWRNEWGAFFSGAVNVTWNELPVPMNQLWRIGVVVNIDNDTLTLG